jgi:RsiW-degrading membrane proteinase PrsW (M82 family)
MTPTHSLHSRGQKTRLFLVLSVGILIALLLILFAEPQEEGWWIWKTVTMPYQFFAGVAFLIAAVYMFALVRWNRSDRFESKTSIMAFLICGGAAILAGNFLYYLFSVVAIVEVPVENGWWLFKTTRSSYQYINSLAGFLYETAAIAGFIEEPSKFAALLVVPQVRRSIVDRRSGLYYATLCALGFALIENISYFQSYQTVLFARANPAHAVFTSIWGAAYGSWVAKELSIAHLLKFFACGIGLHALWNFCASTDPTLFLITFGATIWLGLGFIRKELIGTKAPRGEMSVEQSTDPLSGSVGDPPVVPLSGYELIENKLVEEKCVVNKQ